MRFSNFDVQLRYSKVCLGFVRRDQTVTFVAICGRSEALHTFLISVHRQCCYLTQLMQEVNHRFPQNTSQVGRGLEPGPVVTQTHTQHT